MTLGVSTQASPIATRLVKQTQAGATPDTNVLGAAGTIYLIDIDNSLNAAASYLKLYDALSVTVGTTVPDVVIRVAAGVRRSMSIPEGLAFAVLSMACVTAGGTAGATGPSQPVTVYLSCA